MKTKKSLLHLKNNKMFVNPRDPDNKIMHAKILEWVLAFEEIPRGVDVKIREVTCNDPGCNHTDTYVTIEDSIAFKKELVIRKPLVYIRKWDIVL